MTSLLLRGVFEVMPRPEILAPAGDRRALRVALAAGADAVYFGLDEGFNARARAKNLGLGELREVVAEVHRAGARAYVTFNTLVFESELPRVETLIADVARAGVDALIVQDPAVCLLAQAICPDLELHASTQMTVSSKEAVHFAQALGCTRVVVPRELSLAQIRALRAETNVELEVFIHGALCVSWSGQCLSSEAWGGRSANRGQCAQACRMPYDLILDGQRQDLGDVKYLLSARDLAGYRAIPDLLAIGVHTLKIEGRLKGLAYVSTAVQGLRRWLDAVQARQHEEVEHQDRLAEDVARMTLVYSRGFGDGFFGGSDHQTLVPGTFPRSRGYYLGTVSEVHSRSVEVRADRLSSETVRRPLPIWGEDRASGPQIAEVQPRAGHGVVFDAGNPEDKNEPGGPIFFASPTDQGWNLEFGRPGPDLTRVSVGDRVWITRDPELKREAERLSATEVSGRIAVDLTVSGSLDGQLAVKASAFGHSIAVTGPILSAAREGGIDEGLLSAKLGSFGGTPFRLGQLCTSGLPEGLHAPVSQLKAVRRVIVKELLLKIEQGRPRKLRAAPSLGARVRAGSSYPRPPRLVPLVRTPEQLEAVVGLGFPEVELDWMEMVGLQRAVDRARAAGLSVTVATVRVQKPGEEGYDRRIARLRPDGVLIRHWGALRWFSERPEAERPRLFGDFSLNVTNHLTFDHVLHHRLDSVTVAHDLDAVQLKTLLAAVPPAQTTVTVHHHIPTFHNEHCVYAAHLSSGRDFRSCGRPCDHHRIALRDHRGRAHPVIVDVECRNTVFNAEAQSAASLVPELVAAGVGRLRVEFVWETGEEVRRTLLAYRSLLQGRMSPRACIQEVGVSEQFGVTLGTMQVLS